MLFLQFLFLAVIVVLGAIQLSKQADIIDNNSNLNPIIIGIMLALATSLPELATGITSTLIGQSTMTLSNVLGSNAFNVTILAVMMLVFYNQNLYSRLSNEANKVNYFVLGMYGLFIIGLLFAGDKNIPDGLLEMGRISFVSIFIAILYYVSVKMIKAPEGDDVDLIEVDKKELRKSFYKMAFFSAIIVIAAIYLSKTADAIMVDLGLNASFVGAIFIGVATSLPEFTSALNLCRLKKYDLAATSVLGSNLFNFTIISVVDVIDSTPLVNPDAGMYLLCGVGVITTLLTIAAIKFKQSKSVNAFIAVLVLATYGVYMVLGG